ncbi:MAG: hypothetical protein ACJ74Y_12790 [Bryobacteraceae bacterium]
MLGDLKLIGRLADYYFVNYFHIAYQPSAIIRVSSSTDRAANEGYPSLFVEMQGKRLIVDVKDCVAISAAVTVECDDAMFLGEVVSVTEINGRYQVEICVEQVLSGLQSLMALRAQLLGETAPSTPASQRVAEFQAA